MQEEDEHLQTEEEYVEGEAEGDAQLAWELFEVSTSRKARACCLVQTYSLCSSILPFSITIIPAQVCRSIYEKNPGPDTDIPLSEVFVRLGDLQRFNGKVNYIDTWSIKQ